MFKNNSIAGFLIVVCILKKLLRSGTGAVALVSLE